MGIPRPPSYAYDTTFSSDQRSYQRSVAISHTLQPFEADRFTIKIAVDQSSVHRFRAVLADVSLVLMMSRELIEPTFTEAGIAYIATPLCRPFLDYMEQKYTKQLQERAGWVISVFGSYDDATLLQFFQSHLDRWGGEFITEGLLEEEA